LSAQAQINRLTGRAGQSALEAAAPSSPGYDEGAHFRCHARQGCQKSARIKLLVDNMLGEKTMMIIQTNFTNIAVKDEKMPNRRKRPSTLWLLSPPLYGKSGGKTVDAASFKKALATSQTIFKLKVPHHHPRVGFCGRAKKQTLLAPHSGTFNSSEGVKMIRQLFYLPIWLQRTFFCFKEAKSKPAGLSLFQGGLMKNVEGVA
jgi:hypothetical protein